MHNISPEHSTICSHALAMLIRVSSQQLDSDAFDYTGAVGCLQYLATCPRPDIAYIVNCLSRYVSKPTVEHAQVAKGVLRYVAGTGNVGLKYAGTIPVVGSFDTDFASNVDNRRSTTGYLSLLSGAAISWCSRLQPTVAASTCGAEYMAASSAVKVALWLCGANKYCCVIAIVIIIVFSCLQIIKVQWG
jgi:hypothetical protein